jgi:eukaryotic-like serine/threonine-protein kinase
MTSERWQQVKVLLDRALQLNPAERSAFLDVACSSDHELRAEIGVFLSEKDIVGSSFLRSPAWLYSMDGDGDGGEVAEGGLRGGQLFAERFQLIGKLGEGGMGQVWMAEQTSPVRRTVALKLIRAGMYDGAVVKRFQAERQSLAIMDHPSIAKVFDAGATPQGQPYFVMEYVPGPPITEYCDQKKLAIRERLELFILCCEGVQHAHQKAIIHRDLKPANILVVDVDGKPTPRIIDFGLAKATTAPLAGESLFTQLGHFVGTPAYMSPEQADPSTQDIDTRTDVYSLGVVLYVLLAGSQPFETKPGEKLRLDEVLRKLREEEPPKPSAKVSGDREGSTATAEARGTGPKQLVHDLRGDLDWITMKALEKDRSRRYGTPSELAADIRRYLNHEPVVARLAGTGYRLRKYTRRHRALVLGVAAVFVALLTGVAVSTWEAIRANRAGQTASVERDRALHAENKARAAESTAIQERNRALSEKQRADDESATANAVSSFLQNDLLAQASAQTQATPATKPDPDLKVRTALDRAAAGIAGKFDKQPLEEASIRQTIGKTYFDLGLYQQAQPQVERALELRTRLLGENHPDTLATLNTLADLYRSEGDFPRAEPLFILALNSHIRTLGEEHKETAAAMASLGVLYSDEGKLPLAESMLTKALDIERRVLGPEKPETLTVLYNLAWAFDQAGKYPQSERLAIEVLEVRRRVLGLSHPDTLMSMNLLSFIYRREAKYSLAEPLQVEAVEGLRRVLGEEHLLAQNAVNNLALLYESEGKYALAEPLYVNLLAIRRRVLGADHPDTLVNMHNLAMLYRNERKNPEAETLLTDAIERERRALGAEHRATLASLDALGTVYTQEGKYAQAEPLLLSSVNGRKRVLGEQHPETFNAMADLALLYRQEGKFQQAEDLQLTVLSGERRVFGDNHPTTLNTMHNLGVLYRAEGKYAEAEPLLKEALAGRRSKLGPEHPNTLRSMTQLATLYRVEGKYKEAEAILTEALAIERRLKQVEETNVKVSLGEIQLRLRNYSAAEQLLREALNDWEKTSPEGWQRYYAEVLVGASLAGQQRFAEAEPLLTAGRRGLVERESKIVGDDRRVLTDSEDWMRFFAPR